MAIAERDHAQVSCLRFATQKSAGSSSRDRSIFCFIQPMIIDQVFSVSTNTHQHTIWGLLIRSYRDRSADCGYTSLLLITRLIILTHTEIVAEFLTCIAEPSLFSSSIEWYSECMCIWIYYIPYSMYVFILGIRSHWDLTHAHFSTYDPKFAHTHPNAHAHTRWSDFMTGRQTIAGLRDSGASYTRI